MPLRPLIHFVFVGSFFSPIFTSRPNKVRPPSGSASAPCTHLKHTASFESGVNSAHFSVFTSRSNEVRPPSGSINTPCTHLKSLLRRVPCFYFSVERSPTCNLCFYPSLASPTRFSFPLVATVALRLETLRSLAPARMPSSRHPLKTVAHPPKVPTA